LLHLELSNVAESDLVALGTHGTPEGLRLELKRQLALAKDSDKAEAAKDISAMANSAGGRVVYGIEEVAQPDGSRTAGPVAPIFDAGLIDRLNDILHSAIQPRPRFRLQKVLLSGGGFVLIVEVYPSLRADLHMVTGYGKSRYYKRNDRSALPMTEPEVREAYARVAASYVELDRSMAESVERELQLRAHAKESILVIPWFGRPGLVDPRMLDDAFFGHIARGPLRDLLLAMEFNSRFQPFSGGLRLELSGADSGGHQNARRYLAILRSGLVHFSVKDDLDFKGEVLTSELAIRIQFALRFAQAVLAKSNYVGPLRLVYRATIPPNAYLSGLIKTHFEHNDSKIVEGPIRFDVPEIAMPFDKSDALRAGKEILDQIYQAAGIRTCPWMTPDGEPLEALRQHSSPSLLLSDS
jgi:hypothetical protein